MQQTPPEQGPRIGRGMYLAAWAMALGLLALLLNGPLEERRNPNRDVAGRVQGDVAELSLRQNYGNHYLLIGRINGQEVEFMIDTGASDVAIPAELGATLGLKPGHAERYSTANGTITAHRTRIDTLELGPIRLHNVRASLLPAAGDEVILLGMSALKELELVQRGETLILRQYP